MDFAENIVSNPVTIKLRREEESLDNIKQVTNISNQMLPHPWSQHFFSNSIHSFTIGTDLYHRCGWIAPPQRQNTGPSQTSMGSSLLDRCVELRIVIHQNHLIDTVAVDCNTSMSSG